MISCSSSCFSAYADDNAYILVKSGDFVYRLANKKSSAMRACMRDCVRVCCMKDLMHISCRLSTNSQSAMQTCVCVCVWKDEEKSANQMKSHISQTSKWNESGKHSSVQRDATHTHRESFMYSMQFPCVNLWWQNWLEKKVQVQHQSAHAKLWVSTH